VRADVSIVLCTYNRADMLGPALESLVRQETHGQFRFEVVVVDDGSTDGTQVTLQKIVKDSQVPIRCLRGEGRGIAAARNTGVAAASGEWLAFFDDDQLAEPNWLEELRACAGQAGVDVVGGAVRLHLPDEEIRKISPFCRATLGETNGGRKLGKCFRKTFPGSGNMLVRATVFQAVGQFDESWTRGGSDIELTARLRRAGLEAWFTPKAIVYHHVPAYRLKESYFFWRSIRCGENFANRDFREWGLARTVIACAARIAQATFITFPLMLFAYSLGNRAEVIGRKCSILRAWGYLRQSLNQVSPRLFSQESYFSNFTFRRERSAFAGSSKSTEWRNPSK
jgi:glycosyltransferase involved in cell wall biosynthesis